MFQSAQEAIRAFAEEKSINIRDAVELFKTAASYGLTMGQLYAAIRETDINQALQFINQRRGKSERATGEIPF